MNKTILLLYYKYLKELSFLNERSKNILKQISLTFLYKGGTILCGFILVPLTIHHLTASKYGVWLTLTSFISWFSFFDFGLGNGLRNKLAEAKGLGKEYEAKAYVSSAYVSIGAISTVLILLFITLSQFINWNYFFNIKDNSSDIKILLIIVFISFCLQMVANLITTIFIADQKYSINGLVGFAVQITSIFVVWFLSKTGHVSLISFGIAISIIPLLYLIGLNIIAFSTIYKSIAPSFFLWEKSYSSEITKLGFKFFIIQIAGIILYSTDSYLIVRLFGPEEVTIYNIAFKYFNISAMLLSMIAAPYWSGITDAYVKEDFKWINQVLKNLIKLSFLFVSLIILMLIFSNSFYSFWIGDDIKVPFLLSTFMAFYFVTVILTQPFISVINGTGKVYIQVVLSIILSIVNIPLSIFFGKYLNFGPSGVILATAICNIPGLILYPTQCRKFVKNLLK